MVDSRLARNQRRSTRPAPPLCKQWVRARVPLARPKSTLFRRTGSAATEEVQQQIAAAKTPSDARSTLCGQADPAARTDSVEGWERDSMGQRILTDVSATVDLDRESELVAGFQQLISAPVPDRLIRTDLLRGADGRWRIQTVWRDRDALRAMRTASEPPGRPEALPQCGRRPVAAGLRSYGR